MKCSKCQAENPETRRFCGECGTTLNICGEARKDQISLTKTIETPSDVFGRGTVFADRYEIIEELGAGGMGRVYRAFDKKIEEEVALKLIRPEIAAEKRTVERFRNEIKTARKITHKNVCRTHDLGEEGRALFITMEYVRGEDLKSLIRRTRILAIGTAVLIVRQAAEGLGEAHRLGVVHRDLKPSNVMIDREGNAKIMDFGVARSLEAKGLTGAQAIIGTPEYMSPEQVEGKLADARADIYALGVILFEMVTGRPPFEGETSLAVAHKHKYEPAPDPRTLNPQIPAELGRLILRCMEKERENRYQTTEELLADLAPIEEKFPTSDRALAARSVAKRKSITSKTITVKFTPRKLIIPALALVAIIIGLVKFLPKKEIPGIRDGLQSIAVLPFADLSPDKDQAPLCEGFAEMILNSLANVKSLQVRGRHSSFQFSSRDDPREVGRKLNVEKLLSGTLQKLGNRIRITVQLVNTADGAPLWSEKRDGEMEEIFDIQDMISSMTVGKMTVDLSADDKSGLVRRYTNDKDAYGLYMKGNYILRQLFSVDTLAKARDLYLEAIRKDPEFVLPYIMISLCYAQTYVSFGAGSRDEAYRKSKEFLNKAFAINQEIGEGYSCLADLNFSFEYDLEAAERNHRKAIQLSPQSVFVRESYCIYLASRGRLGEALSEIKTLIEIDPLYVHGYLYLGRSFYFLKRNDDSIAAYQKGLEIDPNNLNILSWMFATYGAQGRYDKALEIAERYEKNNPAEYWGSLALIEAWRGNKSAAEKNKETAKEFFRNPWHAAHFYAAVGERNLALGQLNILFQENRGVLGDCFMLHSFDKYRSDPDFVGLLRKSGFEQ